MIDSYEKFLEEKNDIFDFIKDRINGEIVFCACVGSFVYNFENKDSSVSSKDIDVLCVIKDPSKKESSSSKSNENIGLTDKTTELDIQVLPESRFMDLIERQHLFYLEALFTPNELVFKITDYLKKFKFNESAFEVHMDDNKLKTLKRAKSAFEEQDYLSGKKYINHIMRIDDFAAQMRATGKINPYFRSPIAEFIDDSPIDFGEFVEILNLDKKTSFKI